MKIGILSKRTTHLAAKIKDHLERLGHKITIYTGDNLAINKNLLENDFYILKSKKLFYFYAGHYLEANNKIVIPPTNMTYKIKDRYEAYILVKKAGLLQPEIFVGTLEAVKEKLTDEFFPVIQKPMVSSGSRGVRVLKTLDELNGEPGELIYLQKWIHGTHYNVYFIGDEICALEKPPLSNEHVPMDQVDLTEDIKKIIITWSKQFNQLFGHLDLVREESTNKLYVVDPGSFPVFTNWKLDDDPVVKICDLILGEYERLKSN